MLPGVNGECMSGVDMRLIVGNVAGNMLAKAAAGTMPAKVAEVMAATAFAAAAALKITKKLQFLLQNICMQTYSSVLTFDCISTYSGGGSQRDSLVFTL